MVKKFALAAMCACLCACSTQPLKTAPAEAAKINATLALAYLAQDNVVRSKEKLLLAQHQAPSDPVIWYSSGYFLERTGDFAAAEQSYLHAIALAPTLGTCHNNYGAFLCRRGHYQEAITHFLLAVKDSEYLGVAEAYQNAALCAQKIPDLQLANQYAKLAAIRAGGI